MTEAEQRFNVVYQGNLLPDVTFDMAKNKLMELFSLSHEKAVSILKSKRVILKKNVDKATAEKFAIALKQAGLAVTLTVHKDIALPAHTVPKDGASQEGGNIPPDEPGPLQNETSTPQYHPSETAPFEFRGKGSEYFRIWIVNLILSIITLGIYSAWAKVRRKQYFYASTRLQGTGFEYLADPIKILKGRIIIAIIAISYSVISNLMPIAGTVLSLLFLLILPWIVVRSISFNNRNSAYRNIRFGFSIQRLVIIG